MVNTTISAERQAQFNTKCDTESVDYLSEERGLSNLFKYAVPVYIEKSMTSRERHIDIAYVILFDKWLQEFESEFDIAVALFLVLEEGV